MPERTVRDIEQQFAVRQLTSAATRFRDAAEELERAATKMQKVDPVDGAAPAATIAGDAVTRVLWLVAWCPRSPGLPDLQDAPGSAEDPTMGGRA